jgi:pimeloyl-ACP methyl ester carboxylesterase
MDFLYSLCKGLLFLVVAILTISYVLFRRNTRVERFKAEDHIEKYDLPLDHVEFITADNVALSGWFSFVSSSAPTILLCHGLASSKHTMLVHLRYLYNAGYNVLLFDFRAHGESQGHETSFGALEQRDIDAALLYLDTREVLKNKTYGILGESMGAAAALLCAPYHPEIKAICVDSCYPDLKQAFDNFLHRMKLPIFPCSFFSQFFYFLHFKRKVSDIAPVGAVKRLKECALFIIAGECDHRIPVSESERLFNATLSPRSLWLVPNARHVEAHALEPILYAQKVTDFFKKYLAID